MRDKKTQAPDGQTKWGYFEPSQRHKRAESKKREEEPDLRTRERREAGDLDFGAGESYRREDGGDGGGEI